MHLILETKGFDPLMDVKRQAAERWVAAVNADGRYGRWAYALARKPTEAGERVEEAAGLSPSEAVPTKKLVLPEHLVRGLIYLTEEQERKKQASSETKEEE